MSKQILIDRIEVSLDPKIYSAVGGGQYTILQIEVRSMGRRFNFQEQMRESDIESRFDIYFESAKRQLREALAKHADAQETAVTP